MSYYCKGEKCPRLLDCARVREWQKFPNKDVVEGLSSGVWFVQEEECINNNFEDLVLMKRPKVRDGMKERLFMCDNV